MSRVTHPSTELYREFASFLRDFIKLNKEKGVPMSLGFLSKKLGWSRTLLSDLSHGHRRLTIEKALEFADYARMEPSETETLLSWALENHENREVAEAFRTKVDPQNSPQIGSSAVSLRERNIEFLHHYYSNLHEMKVEDYQYNSIAAGMLCLEKKHLQEITDMLEDLKKWTQEKTQENLDKENEKLIPVYLDFSVFDLLGQDAPHAESKN